MLHILVRANDNDEDAEPAAVHRHLPQSSSDVLASHSCKGDDVRRLLENDDDGDDGTFFRWVLSARHSTWDPPGWEVAFPRLHRPSTSSSRDVPSTISAEEDDGDKYYARVFDLLDWSRGRNLLPVPVDISLICHKGMDSPNNNTTEGRGGSRHSAGLPWDASCAKQLRSTARVSSSCIDIPGIIVANPPPPMRANNPCHLPYRMVDGAHRICLRKYLLHVATEELIGLEGVDDDDVGASENGTSSDDGSRHRRTMRLREVIDRARIGHFLVLDQTTFESMLTNVDPHSHWAKDRHHMKSAVTTELRREWQAWMGRVMDRVWEADSDDAALECSSASGTSE
ncbi:hypothetical protein ACHAW5_011326 [Stephanodiscus triporus]|uniref:ParB/Sulfiredoxin domain-containing protein n=1 Tax=Stephanodiscus triporus TaxID=2934178 RepID=A0ABD3QU90_9STRA